MAEEDHPSPPFTTERSVTADRFLRTDGKALTMRPPPAPAAQRLKVPQLKVWSAEEIWSAARDRDRSPRRGAPRRNAASPEAEPWHRAANEALMQLAEQPGNGFMEELKLSVEALDLLQAWMEQLLRQTLAKAARLARHGAAGDGDDGPGEIRAQELRMALELQGFANLGC